MYRLMLILMSVTFSIGILLSSCVPPEEETAEVKEQPEYKLQVVVASAIDETNVSVTLKYTPPQGFEFKPDMFVIRSDADTNKQIKVIDVKPLKKKEVRLTLGSPITVDDVWAISTSDDTTFRNKRFINYEKILYKFYSDKPLGHNIEGGVNVFRVFSSRATKITLVIADDPIEMKNKKEYDMTRDPNGVWEAKVEGNLFGKYYGYRVSGPKHFTEAFDPDLVIFDPYAKAIAVENSYKQKGMGVIIDTSKYNWEGTDWVRLKAEDAIIYESHLRDFTAHPSSGVPENIRGTYKGFIYTGKGVIGGITWLKELGVNAVEFLPIHESGTYEPPFGQQVEHAGAEKGGTIVNTWNAHSRNHWGYMTTSFFSPESYYSSGDLTPGKYSGLGGVQVNEFKDVVKALHKEKIAVMLDVVYNHVSQYDYNPLKRLDKKYYFFMNDFHGYDARSGCGNDVDTAKPMASRLVVDSVKYWMVEYKIDGYRFDLATIIDWKTHEKIIAETKKLNPEVILVAEPWGGGRGEPRDGGGYTLVGFSKRGMGAWNDRVRNFIRGSASASSKPGAGIVFGKGSNDDMRRFVLGFLRDVGGEFYEKGHNINYGESHDNETLGDFIRIGNGDYKPHQVVNVSKAEFVKLTPKQLAQNKIAALFLFTIQGGIMIHQGQEFARTKIVDPNSPWLKDFKKDEKGNWYKEIILPNGKTNRVNWPGGKAKPLTVDHDSYEKDDDTNWINYEEALKIEPNRELLEYYKGLIAIRKKFNPFRKADIKAIKFINAKENISPTLGWILPGDATTGGKDIVVLVNANHNSSATFTLPEGEWDVLANEKVAGLKPVGTVSGEVVIQPIAGMILIKK
ncbi:MAG: pullulanase [Spirochaetes bacterium]|nr:pullulanase [Spirochaetota bacterium]